MKKYRTLFKTLLIICPLFLSACSTLRETHNILLMAGQRQVDQCLIGNEKVPCQVQNYNNR